MYYGAKGIDWAPITEEKAGALPTYGEVMRIGELNKVTDAPAFAEAKAYGDNALARHVAEFKECPLDIEVLDMPKTVVSAITGAKISEGDAKDLHFNEADNPPYGGVVFYVNELLADNRKVFTGFFYPKAKAVMQGETYSTKGESVTLTGKKLRLTASTAKNGDWKVESDYLETEEAAIAWCKAKLGAAAAT